MQKTIFLSIFYFLSILSTEILAQNSVVLKSNFKPQFTPIAPDYTQDNSWAALPTKSDPADRIPLKLNVAENQANAKADVFFLHPTTFTYEPKNQYQWNADINDAELNEKTDNSTILNQATAFNGSGKIYAPRYRQAHYYSFLTPNADDKKQALDVAYSDIKAAFEYYLKNWNQGRPIIIASHSQGTVHAKRLLKEFFDGKLLQKQLVEAYLIGIATQPDTFENIKPSQSADEIGGFVSWNTYARNYLPEYYKDGLSTAVSTNPLTWKLDEEFAPKELNKGGVGYKFTFVKQAADAQNHQGILWINKPYIRGRAFINLKIWHIADINLFWMNIRENIALRLETYLKQ